MAVYSKIGNVASGKWFQVNDDGTVTLHGLNFNTSPDTSTGLSEGECRWNALDRTLDIGVDGDNVVLQVGMELLYPTCVNKSGADISNGQLVMYDGAIGNSGQIKIAKASTTLSLPGQAMGLATEDIPNDAVGHVTWYGLVRGISTDGSLYGEEWIDGQLLYNSASVAGGLSKTKPAPPTSAVFVGVVINANVANGVMFVRPMFFPTVEQLSNVYVSNIQDGQILKWVSANNRWENKTP